MVDLLIPLILFLVGSFFICQKFSIKKRLPIYFFLSLFLYSLHRLFSPEPVVCEVLKGSTADSLGWMSNDKILSINHASINNINDFLQFSRSLDEEGPFFQEFAAKALRNNTIIDLPIRIFPSEKPFLFEPLGSKRISAISGGLNFFCRQPLIQSLTPELLRIQRKNLYTEPTARVLQFGPMKNVKTISDIDAILSIANDTAVIPMQTQSGWTKRQIHIPLKNSLSKKQKGYLQARKLSTGFPDLGETVSSYTYGQWIHHGVAIGSRILEIEDISLFYPHQIRKIFKERTSKKIMAMNVLSYKLKPEELRSESIFFHFHPNSFGLFLMPDLIRFSSANSESFIKSIFLFPVIETQNNFISNWSVLYRSLRRDLGFSNSWYRLPYNYFSQLDFWLYKISQIFFILFLVEIPFLFLTIKRKHLSYTYVFLTSILLLAKSIWMQNEL
ncbi:MAG: hypothetical protein M9962_12380 [Oligoflexia bacterium]|nr:hypothetical protein [Oligoflexia bacterium]